MQKQTYRKVDNLNLLRANKQKHARVLAELKVDLQRRRERLCVVVHERLHARERVQPARRARDDARGRLTGRLRGDGRVRERLRGGRGVCGTLDDVDVLVLVGCQGVVDVRGGEHAPLRRKREQSCRQRRERQHAHRARAPG